MNMQNTRRELTPQEVKMLALVVLASSSYPSIQGKDPRPIVEAWAMMLADLDAVVAKAAIIKVCRESQFFPSVAQIVAAAEALDPRTEKLPTAAEAWEEVVQLIRNFGPYRAPLYSCDTLKRAVRAIGWQQLCMGENPEADRAHFLRLYESMRSRYREDRENEKVLALSGMGEVVKALAGRLAAK